MDQSFLNWVYGVLFGLLVWLGRTVWDAVQTLKTDIQKLEVILPREYITRVEMERRLDKADADINRRLDKIDETLNHIWQELREKADKE